MTGIICQAMFMPGRAPGLGSRSAIPPASLDIAGRPRRSACLKNDACSAKADALEDHRAILGNVLFDQDARLGSALRLRRGVLVIENAIAQIFAIMLDHVEDIEDCGTGGRASALPVQTRQAFESKNQRACRRTRLLPASRCRPVIAARVGEPCLRSGC